MMKTLRQEGPNFKPFTGGVRSTPRQRLMKWWDLWKDTYKYKQFYSLDLDLYKRGNIRLVLIRIIVKILI